MNTIKIELIVKNLLKKLNLNEYIGILVYGSYIGNRTNKLSDLDIMIIKDDYSTQDCGSFLIDGIRVEFFINDLSKLYRLVKNEINHNDPSHLTKFATCQVLFDTDKRVENFICYAKNLYNTNIHPSFDDNDKFSIFSINNRIEDLESLTTTESFYSVYYVVLEKIRTLYSHINGIIDLPITKIEKIYNDEDFANKYISSSSHVLPNEKFISLYLECLNIKNKEIMIKKLKKLYEYSFPKKEFDPKNFWLKFPNDVASPFKV